MNRYIYTDNSEHPKTTVIFECDTENILAADTLYKEVVGTDPQKQTFVSVQVYKPTE